MANQEHLIDSIMGIRKSGFASMTYWSIAVSNKSIYLCQLGKNGLYGIWGTARDLDMLIKVKKTDQDIESILKSSDKYYTFDIEKNNDITYAKTFLGGDIDFAIENDKRLKLKLNNKQFNKFLNAIK